MTKWGAEVSKRISPLPTGGTGGRLEKKIFWALFIGLGLMADLALPLFWGVVATIPIAAVSWWVAYRSNWLG